MLYYSQYTEISRQETPLYRPPPRHDGWAVFRYIDRDVCDEYNRTIMEQEDAKTIMRHFDVVAEDLKENIKTLAEQVAANTVKLEEHDQRFDQIDQRFDLVDQKFDQVDHKFDQIDKRFEQVDKRFDQIDQRFEQVDKRFDQIDQRFEQVDKRFDQIDQRFDHTDEELNVIKLNMETMKNDLIQKVSRNEFSILEKRVSMIESKI